MRPNFSFISVLLIAMVTNISLSAQSLRWGAQTGVNINAPDSENTRIGFNVGGKTEYNFRSPSKGWLVDAEINLSYIPYGQKVSYEHETTPGGTWQPSKTADFNNNTYFLNLPVTAGYRVAVSDNVSININAGMFFNVGLWGRAKLKYPGFDMDESSFKKGSEGGDMKRFNYGAIVKVGLQFKEHYQLSVSYNNGLSKPGCNHAMSNRQRMFNISLGYIF